MIQRLPFHENATVGDVARLQVLLRDALAALQLQKSRPLTVLNLACGRADETGALAAAFVPASISYYLGIDLRPGAIEEAAKRWSLPQGRIEFRCGDVSLLHQMKQLPRFDFIFIRHQNYWDSPATWDRLLEGALGCLAPEGVLACTSYFDGEHDLLLASLKTRGAELLWNVRHPASRKLPEIPGKSVDRNLAIFRAANI